MLILITTVVLTLSLITFMVAQELAYRQKQAEAQELFDRLRVALEKFKTNKG
jgi:heme/copper-type cytochrome/quinol oxidase subunit 3